MGGIVEATPVAIHTVLGEQQPHERELVVLVRERGVDDLLHLVVAGPLPRVGQPPLRDPDPCPLRRDRSQVGEETGQVERLRLAQQLDRPFEVTLGTAQARHGHIPAVPVLEQRRRLPQLLRRPQVLPCGSQLPLLDEDVGQPDVQVTQGGEGGAVVPACGGQGALQQSPRLDRTPPSHPHAGEDHRAAQLIGDVTGRPHALHRRGERLDRLLEVAPGPGREAEEAQGTTPRHVVPRSGEVQRDARVVPRRV